MLAGGEGAGEPRLPVRGRRGVVRAADAEGRSTATRRAASGSSASASSTRSASEDEPPLSEATIMIEGPDGEIEHTAAQGNGPVQRARPRAAQGAGEVLPADRRGRSCSTTRCACSVGGEGTAALVRVLIESGDGARALGHRRRVAQRHRGQLAGARRSLDYKLYKDGKRAAADAASTGDATGRAAHESARAVPQPRRAAHAGEA